MVRVLIVLFTICILGRCQERFDDLDEIEREVRSENNEITTEDLETIVKRDIWDDFRQKMNKTSEEYITQLVACGLANNFVPYENCTSCKAVCKDTEMCKFGQCRKICRADKKFVKSKCKLIVDKAALKAMWKKVGKGGQWKNGQGYKKNRGRWNSRNRRHHKHFDDV